MFSSQKQWACLALKTTLQAALKIDSRREAGRPIGNDGRPPSARWWQLRSAVRVVGRGPESRYILKIVSFLCDLDVEYMYVGEKPKMPLPDTEDGVALLGYRKQRRVEGNWDIRSKSCMPAAQQVWTQVW